MARWVYLRVIFLLFYSVDMIEGFLGTRNTMKAATRRNKSSNGHRTKIIRPAVLTKFTSFDKCVETVGSSNEKNVVLVDFYATWCGPCEDMAVILEEVATELVEKVGVVKVDTDKNPTLTSRFRIEAFPTLVMMRSGEEVDRIMGMATKSEIITKIEDINNNS